MAAEPRRPTRRTFLKSATAALAATMVPDAIAADPYAPIRPIRPTRGVIRIRGAVRSGGRPVAGAGVTDGLEVVSTDRDGRFEILSGVSHGWVSVSVPSGYEVPLHATGTAAHAERIVADGRSEMSVSFELKRRTASDERHAFLLLADPQTENVFEMERFHAETVPDVRGTVQSLGDVPVFGVSCGDIMFDDLSLYPEYERAVAAMGIPFFQVVGNHDLDFDERTDERTTATFERHFGPSYYSSDCGRVHYIVLDDVFWHGQGYIGYLQDMQLAWLANDLARVEAGRTVVVMTHIPVLGSQHRRRGERNPSTGIAIMNRQALYRLLEPYNAHLLTGHTHESEHVFEAGTHEHVNGAVCGAWWSGDICHDGTPNGYGVFEADGDALRWRYKATGKPIDHQLRVYARGADPRAPDEIVANVWDWDPDWTVVWYEGADRRGAMARRTGLDPWAVAQHTGPEKPARREWVEPVLTDHLFYAPARADTDVRIEVTDRFGRTYTASPEPARPTG